MPIERVHEDEVLDQFTRQARGYARLTEGMRRSERTPPALALIAPKPDDVLLDVACGAGSLTLQLAPLVAYATGIDITPAMLDQARAAADGRGIANVDWALGDSEHLPYTDGAFSLVTSSAAFHHLERSECCVRCAASVGPAGASS